MKPKQQPCFFNGLQTRRGMLQATIIGLLASELSDAKMLAQEAVPSASDTHLEVHAYGQTLGEVVAHISQFTSGRLSVSADIGEERVAIAFRGSASAFLEGLASCFGLTWVELGSAQNSRARHLQAKRSVRALEEQLRMAPFRKMAVGLQHKADATLAKLQEAPNTLYEISTAWGERFLSLLTPAEIDGALEQGYLTASVGQLNALAQDALFHFVETRLKAHAVELPDYKAKLEALTPENVRASTVVVRARSTPWGGNVKANVLGVDAAEAVLGIEAARLPQRISPYVSAAQSRRVAKPGDAQQAPGRPVELPNASKILIDIEAPKEWGQVVAAVQRSLGKNVFSDCYTPSASDREQAERTARRYHATNAPTFLDDLCRHWRAVWWEQSGSVCIRQQFWYMLKQCEPPLPIRRQLEGDIREGTLRGETLMQLAVLSRPQLLTLLQHIALDAEFEVDESAFADFLALYAAGTVGDHEAIGGQGLPLKQFSSALLEALRRLAPDSAISMAAQKSSSEFYLKVEQMPVAASEGASQSYARLRFHVAGPAGAASQRFQAPIKDTDMPLIVSGVKK